MSFEHCFPKDRPLVLRSIMRNSDPLGDYYDFNIDGQVTRPAPAVSREREFDKAVVSDQLKYLSARNVKIPSSVVYCDNTKTPTEILRLDTASLALM